MADFSYVAIMPDGKQKKGSMEAKDADKVRAQLKADGLIPVSVKEQGVMTKDIDFGSLTKVKPRDLGIFCRQFGSVLTAGVTVIKALEMLSEQTENKKLAEGIKTTKAGVEKGETLGNAMRSAKGVFPDIMINMIDAGEASGSLDIAFERMATHFEKDAKLKALVKKAFMYPIVITIVTVIVVVIMSIYVVPKFADMFEDMGSEMPGITLMVLAISNFFRYKWYIALAVVVAIIVGLKLFGATDTGKHVFGKLSIKAPIFGKLNVKTASASMARTLSTLTAAGLSISSALEITGKSLSNILYKDAMDKARSEVEQGVPLSDPLKKCGIFPPMVYHMVGIGEETGNVEGMLSKVADYYEEEVEITTQSLTALMEPLIIVVFGIIVGVIVLALYMPMINMYNNVNNL